MLGIISSTAHLLLAVLFAAFLSSSPSRKSREIRAAQGVVPDADSALAMARELQQPAVVMTSGGEFEGGEWWDQQQPLLLQAWVQWGHLHEQLFTFNDQFEDLYVSPSLRAACDRVRSGYLNESEIRALFSEMVPGVWGSTSLMTPLFVKHLVEELDHMNHARIPMRRPNGMNRYGAILDHIGFDLVLHKLSQKYLRPLVQLFFPAWIGENDAIEKYSFVVQYEQGGDTDLAEHGDASVATLNLCLGDAGFEGGALAFRDDYTTYPPPKITNSSPWHQIDFRPGMAVLHKGQHKHTALPLTSGRRLNMVLWLMGKWGGVRVAPYKESERLSMEARWGLGLGPQEG
jgi:hypothetical protein